tara:strand:- start:8231 stop:8701 length:471 start_codon:yes stop_codon:yes gene_type:complete
MLEYVAAANAAYSVIKKAIENGRELGSVAKHISKFTHAADSLAEQKNKKKNSIWAKFTGKEENDLDEFFALEDIKQKEEELKRLMIYLGRPGLHSDWVRFQVEARKRRQQEAKDRQKSLDDLYENIKIGLLILFGVAVAAAALFLLVVYLQRKGVI